MLGDIRVHNLQSQLLAEKVMCGAVAWDSDFAIISLFFLNEIKDDIYQVQLPLTSAWGSDVIEDCSCGCS